MSKNSMEETILQNILQHGDIGIHVIDRLGKTIMYNDAMAHLEGLEKDYVMDRDMLEIFPSLREETSTLLQVIKEGRPIINETQTYLNYEGKEITSINSTIPLFINGEIIGALEIARDLTYIKNLSDRLFDLQEELKLKKENPREIKRINRYRFEDIIGNSPSLIKVKSIGKRASNTPSNVLIYGETGTGKELFAQSIHYGGNRKDKAFIAQNCAAIPETLLEGILFGTEKGGFTGAIEREGIFEQASGGTLMLDEINSMSLPLQAKLLRVLQEGYIRRIGGKKDIPIDVRIIATTNEEPLRSIEKGTLRKDLFYRLNVVSISIPPLRDRKEDIDLLSNHFIKKYNRILNRNIKYISQEGKAHLFQYSWPGNVRELENTIESAMNMVEQWDNVLELKDFTALSNKLVNFQNQQLNELNYNLPDILGNMEKAIIIDRLKQNNNNITKSAEDLGIKRQTLQHKIKKYDIKTQ